MGLNQMAQACEFKCFVNPFIQQLFTSILSQACTKPSMELSPPYQDPLEHRVEVLLFSSGTPMLDPGLIMQ